MRSQDRALEHVGAGADEVRVDLIGTRLLDELPDRGVLVEAHEAVGARILDRHERERARRAGALVLGDLRAEIEVAQDVAIEHQEALVQQRLGELQRTAGPAGSGSSTKRSRIP